MMRWLLVCLAITAWALPIPRSVAQPPEPPSRETPTLSAHRDDSAKALPLDKLKLPPGGVMVLVEQAQGALQFFPKMVLLTPEKFQEMMDRISALERQLKSDKKLPSVCKITGRLDGDAVHLQAEYRFTTERPGATVFLGGQGAVITEAKWGLVPGQQAPRNQPSPAGTGGKGQGQGGGQAPFLEPGDNGYSVRVEKPGEQVLILRFQAPVVARTTPATSEVLERGFELGLPGAAVTLLTLDLPAGVKELHWNEFTEKATQGTNIPSSPATKTGRWVVPIGRVKNLNVSWKEPVNIPGAGPLRTVDGQVIVQIQEGQVSTTADLTLVDLRGRTREWRLWVPSGAKLDIKTPPGLTAEVIGPATANAPHELRLSEPTTEKVHVVAQMTHARPFTQLPVGPFTALDVYRQQGTITIKATPETLRGLKPVYHRQGEVVERDIPKEAATTDTIAVFKYWNMLPPGTPMMSAPLEIELQPVKGAVETQVEHTLRLKQVQEGWQVLAVTRIHAKPLHDGIDYLEVQLPRPRPEGLAVLALAPPDFLAAVPWSALGVTGQPNWPARVPQDYDVQGEEGADAAELVVPADKAAGPMKARRAGIKLHRFLSKRFTVVLTGTYTLPTGVQSARLELPRPVGVLDRGAKLNFEVEGNLELLGNDSAAAAPSLFGFPVSGDENRPGRRHRQTSLWQRTPTYAVLAWKPYRSDLGVRTVADVTDRSQYAHVRQEFSLQAGDLPEVAAAKKKQAAALSVYVPSAVRGLTISGGGKLQRLDADRQMAWIVASTEGAALEQFVAEFDFLLPPSEKRVGSPATASRQVQVPLLWAEAATRADTRVRFWCDSGNVPVLVQPDAVPGPWRDQAIEMVPGRNSLPALVVTTDTLHPPLRVRLQDVPTSPGSVAIDHGLVQVIVDEDGTEYYRARYQITRLATHHLDVELPAPPAGLMLQVALDHKKLAWQLAESSSPTAGNVVRLAVEPGLYAHPVVLDLTYRLTAGRPLGSWPWRNSLLPPRLQGAVLLGRVHWQITLPSRLVGFVPAGDAYIEQRRDWYGWPSAEPTAAAVEFEQRFEPGSSQASAAEPNIVCWRTNLSPLTLIRAPWQIWFLLCSGVVLGSGLGVSFLPRAWLALWLFALVLALALGAGAILWPTALPYVFYGCLPGAGLLVVLLAVQWMIHRQYRRQLVFMPGFTRLKSGSSLIRTGSLHPAAPVEGPEGRVREGRPHEPSTVDHGPSAGGDSSSRTGMNGL